MSKTNEKEQRIKKLEEFLKDASNIYNDHYIFLYPRVIFYLKEKPLEPVLEIERAFSHLMQAFKDIEGEKGDSFTRNLDRFLAHVERCILDMYKLTLLGVQNEIDSLKEAFSENTFGRDKYNEIQTIIETFKSEYTTVRTQELNLQGKDKKALLENYKALILKIEHLLKSFKNNLS